MKYEIYTATDITDGEQSFFLVKPSTGEAVCVYQFSSSQIDFLAEQAAEYDALGSWFTTADRMGDDKILLRSFEA
jgi:hypothetical protein|nr:MAG TPA: hypothetical protein [Caudoviricetes sp.]